MRVFIIALAIALLAAAGYAQASVSVYAEPAYSLEKTARGMSVSARGQDTGYVFLEFPANTSSNRFSLDFSYRVKSENPEYDPSIFLRVYPAEQVLSSGWVKVRTEQECYYYTASNGEIIPVGGTPLLTGRLEAWGPSKCKDKDCDYYKQDNTVLPIPDSTWLDKSITVSCNNTGTVYLVLELNKKSPGWIEWSIANVSVNGEMISFEKQQPEKPQENKTTVPEDQGKGNQQEQEEKKVTISILSHLLEYSAAGLAAAVLAAGIMFIRKKKRMEVQTE